MKADEIGEIIILFEWNNIETFSKIRKLPDQVVIY